MWAFVQRLFGFGLNSAPRPVPVRVVERREWNGTILSGETYR